MADIMADITDMILNRLVKQAKGFHKQYPWDHNGDPRGPCSINDIHLDEAALKGWISIFLGFLNSFLYTLIEFLLRFKRRSVLISFI